MGGGSLAFGVWALRGEDRRCWRGGDNVYFLIIRSGMKQFKKPKYFRNVIKCTG
jgi:hypothetical protein